MANFNHAPILQYDKNKDLGTNYYQLPQKLMDTVCRKLGNSSAQLRIMMVLIGTKPGFAISEQWILDRTGLSQPSYIKARKALIDMGWITLDKGKSIIINFKTIGKTQ